MNSRTFLLSLGPLILLACSHTSQKASDRNPNSVADISMEQVSSELGLTTFQLESMNKVFADFLDSEKFPTEFCSKTQLDQEKKVCQLMEKIKFDLTKIDSQKVHGRLKKSTIAANQSLSYGNAIRLINNVDPKKILKWSDDFITSDTCPRNLTAAAARKLEEVLVKPEAFTAIEKLYENASKCLKPEDEGYEATHFREALLRRLKGDNDGAKKSIQLAVNATNSDEKGRVLFWAGVILENSGPKNKYWQKLVEKQPLTFHALQVWNAQTKDPLEMINDRNSFDIVRSVEGPNSNTTFTLRWVEVFYLTNRFNAGDKLTKWMSQTSGPIPKATVMYFATLATARAKPHNTISFLTTEVIKDPTLLNAQVLKLLFPIPYYDVFEKYCDGIDAFLVLGLARQESAFDPSIVSKKKARGLMQLLPMHAKRGKKRDLFDAEVNARIGIKFLNRLIDKYEGVEFALAAYNAGPARIVDWKKRYPTKDLVLFMDLIPFKETRNYVASILRNNYWYHRLYVNDPALKRDKFSDSNRSSHLVSDMLAVQMGRKPTSLIR